MGNLVHVARGRDFEHVFVDGQQVVDGGRPGRIGGLQMLVDHIRSQMQTGLRIR